MAFDKKKNPKKQRAGCAGNEKRWRAAGGAVEGAASGDAPAATAIAPIFADVPDVALASSEHDATAPGSTGTCQSPSAACPCRLSLLTTPTCTRRPDAASALMDIETETAAVAATGLARKRPAEYEPEDVGHDDEPHEQMETESERSSSTSACRSLLVALALARCSSRRLGFESR